jgi:urate oxidase
MPHLNTGTYGESRLRMLRVMRKGDRHDPKDLTIAIRFEGDVSARVPGEAIKNLVHRVAREHDYAAIESLGLAMCARILAEHPSIGLARIEIVEQPWGRLEAGGKPQNHSFTPNGVERRTATVSSNGTRVSVSAGLDDLILLRTAGFAPIARGRASDEPAADGLQRLFIATFAARWAYTSGEIAFLPYRQGVRSAIVDTFAWHKGRSAHDTLTEIADVILASFSEISEISLSLQERPYRPVDLLELSLDGDTLFVAHDEPVGTVEVTVTRES